MIWATSDLHFNHPGILRMSRSRFSSIEEHNEYIIKKYNEKVGKDDLVYILGDIGFTPLKDLAPLIKRLNGRKILILGNHDKGVIGEYYAMGFIEVYDHPIYFSNEIILSHEPCQEALNNPYVFNIHGHTHMRDLVLDNYINICPEKTNYEPVDLKHIQSEIKDETKSRRERFGKEWYYNLYDFSENA